MKVLNQKEIDRWYKVINLWFIIPTLIISVSVLIYLIAISLVWWKVILIIVGVVAGCKFIHCAVTSNIDPPKSDIKWSKSDLKRMEQSRREGEKRLKEIGGRGRCNCDNHDYSGYPYNLI